MRISDWSSDVCSSDLIFRAVWPLELGPAGRTSPDRRLAGAPPRRLSAPQTAFLGSGGEKKAGPKARARRDDPNVEGTGSGAARLLRRADALLQYAMFCDQYASICWTSSSGSGT